MRNRWWLRRMGGLSYISLRNNDAFMWLTKPAASIFLSIPEACCCKLWRQILVLALADINK